MKTSTINTALTIGLLLATFNAQLSNIFAQGSLTPPGAPAPTMKSLDQIEPRTPIASLPFAVTNAGSYYLTRNLTNSTLYTDGITIQANDVTIDFRGFILAGSSNSGAGVSIQQPFSNVWLHDGTIRDWTDYGLRAFYTRNVVCERLRALNNGSGGFGLSTNGAARECVAQGNRGYGFYATLGGSMVNCTASDNAADGVQAESNCTISRSFFSNNNTNLLNNAAAINLTGTGNRIEANQVVGNRLKGIQDNFSPGTNIIIGNTARANAGGNYNLNPTSVAGPIITATGTITNLSPWANFSY